MYAKTLILKWDDKPQTYKQNKLYHILVNNNQFNFT